MKHAIVLSFIFVFISNCFAYLIYLTNIDRQFVYLAWTIILLTSVVFWSRRYANLSWNEIGLGGKPWRSSLLVGIAVGLLLSIPLLVALSSPLLFAEPVRYREIENLNLLGLFWRLGIELLIATVLTEEILFRGILYALFKHSMSTTRAVIFTNIAFSLWHLWANALSVQQNAIVLPLVPTEIAPIIAYLGSLVAVGIAGVGLSILRIKTGHLAASIATHWVAVAAMTILVFVQ